MCGFVGVVNLKQNISDKKQMIIDMNNSLSRRGPDECGYYTENLPVCKGFFRRLLTGCRFRAIIFPLHACEVSDEKKHLRSR